MSTTTEYKEKENNPLVEETSIDRHNFHEIRSKFNKEPSLPNSPERAAAGGGHNGEKKKKNGKNYGRSISKINNLLNNRSNDSLSSKGVDSDSDLSPKPGQTVASSTSSLSLNKSHSPDNDIALSTFSPNGVEIINSISHEHLHSPLERTTSPVSASTTATAAVPTLAVSAPEHKPKEILPEIDNTHQHHHNHDHHFHGFVTSPGRKEEEIQFVELTSPSKDHLDPTPVYYSEQNTIPDEIDTLQELQDGSMKLSPASSASTSSKNRRNSHDLTIDTRPFQPCDKLLHDQGHMIGKTVQKPQIPSHDEQELFPRRDTFSNMQLQDESDEEVMETNKEMKKAYIAKMNSERNFFSSLELSSLGAILPKDSVNSLNQLVLEDETPMIEGDDDDDDQFEGIDDEDGHNTLTPYTSTLQPIPSLLLSSSLQTKSVLRKTVTSPDGKKPSSSSSSPTVSTTSYASSSPRSRKNIIYRFVLFCVMMFFLGICTVAMTTYYQKHYAPTSNKYTLKSIVPTVKKWFNYHIITEQRVVFSIVSSVKDNHPKDETLTTKQDDQIRSVPKNSQRKHDDQNIKTENNRLIKKQQPDESRNDSQSKQSNHISATIKSATVKLSHDKNENASEKQDGLLPHVIETQQQDNTVTIQEMIAQRQTKEEAGEIQRVQMISASTQTNDTITTTPANSPASVGGEGATTTTVSTNSNKVNISIKAISATKTASSSSTSSSTRYVRPTSVSTQSRNQSLSGLVHTIIKKFQTLVQTIFSGVFQWIRKRLPF